MSLSVPDSRPGEIASVSKIVSPLSARVTHLKDRWANPFNEFIQVIIFFFFFHAAAAGASRNLHQSQPLAWGFGSLLDIQNINVANHVFCNLREVLLKLGHSFGRSLRRSSGRLAQLWLGWSRNNSVESRNGLPSALKRRPLPVGACHCCRFDCC